MRSITFITMCFFLFSGWLYARNNSTIPIKVKEITMESTYSKGLSGILIQLTLDQPLKMEEDIFLTYELNELDLKRDLLKLRTPDTLKRVQIFFPFHQLFTTSGRQRVHFLLKGIFKEQDEMPLTVEGKKAMSVEVDVPVIYTVKLKVDYIAVAKTNEKGNAWDYHIFSTKESDNYPDLLYTIETDYNELGQGSTRTVLYSSHRQNDTLEASWTYFSEPVKLCKGDKVKVCIKDGDTVFHDKIGCIELDQLKAMQNIRELAFDSVLKFTAVLVTK